MPWSRDPISLWPRRVRLSLSAGAGPDEFYFIRVPVGVKQRPIRCEYRLEAGSAERLFGPS
jgi:hypothetical protein